ncbi:MAG: DUF1460 domain-containing protein, partial [Prevotellaceae bacterium]|nr:DUF1460 domain-containing protein [Prevotellaceae bacterium]
MKQLILLPFFLFFTGVLNAQTANDSILYIPEDKEIFNDYITQFSDKKDLPIGDLLVKTGEYFLDTPYVHYTLEAAAPDEKLIVNLRELDCTTFTETVLALARTLKSGNPTFEQYCNEL